MGCVQTNRLEVVFNVQSISVKIGRCSAHKISPKNLRAVTYLFQPLLFKKRYQTTFPSPKFTLFLDIHQKTTRKGGDVLSHWASKTLRCPQVFLASCSPILEAHEIENPSRSIQGVFTPRLLKHRLYWHIPKNFKDLRRFLPEKTDKVCFKKKKVHDLVILSCPENSQPPKIKETAPGTVYIYIPEKVGSKSTKSSCNLQLPFLNSAVASPFWTGIGFWIKSLSIQT